MNAKQKAEITAYVQAGHTAHVGNEYAFYTISPAPGGYSVQIQDAAVTRTISRGYGPTLDTAMAAAHYAAL